MKIVRQTESEIVVEDSSPLLSLHNSTFVFNAKTQSIQWTRQRMFRKETGSIAFSEIQNIVLETTTGDDRPRGRLAITTATDTMPMSDGYSASRDDAATICATLLNFIRPAPAAKSPTANVINTDAFRTQQLNDSIRLLLRQGKKIDAILLVQRSEHLDLTEATFRVNQVANRMGMKQTAAKA